MKNQNSSFSTHKFREAELEAAVISLLERQGYEHVIGADIKRAPHDVLIKQDLRNYLSSKYAKDNISVSEIDGIIRRLEAYSAGDLYESNKAIMKMVQDGFLLKREDAKEKDIHIKLIDCETKEAFQKEVEDELMVADASANYLLKNNIYKIVNQLEIEGYEKRIPDGILYINGLPLVVFEFKSAIREEATIHDAFIQLTVRYSRDIPELFKYNAFCVISDGANNKAGSFFAAYEFYYSWRAAPSINADQAISAPRDGINSLYAMVEGMFNPLALGEIIRNFIYIPDASKRDEKILCRYPQYYAATKLYANILTQMKPGGDGKGGTYFGATGCGKSYTMLFLTRLLMKSVELGSPTIVLITDRTDLDDQLSSTFENAKTYIGDQIVQSVTSRSNLRELLKGRHSGGVFLTTIHKFTEDIELLTERCNVICISDEAHRSQVNLDQKLKITEEGVKKTYGFAKYLHDSLPNATYVGFTGTPIDATLDVFGPVIDAYTMTESVRDEITVHIVYEGRAAKLILDNGKLEEIERYYDVCADEGASEYQIEESKKATTKMHSILGDPDRIQSLASDFVRHYETRLEEGATLKGKAMFVSSSRSIAYMFYKELMELRPEWGEVLICEEGAELTEKEKKEIQPMERVKMIMTRNQDDPKELYEALGNKDYRKDLDRQFKNAKSNFKIAIVVDMWLTGFDVPFLDTIYIDKPLQKHSLIQTISRVNRKFEGKEKGLVVDYIGIKKQMNQALAQYGKGGGGTFEDVNEALIVVKDHLALLETLFHSFNKKPYFTGSPVERLHNLNMAVEFVQLSQKLETRFMGLVKRLKAAYDICCGSEGLSEDNRDHIHFYLAVRSILFKLTKGDAPDTAQMNKRVQQLIQDALKSDGVEEIFKLGDEQQAQIDIFDEDYLAKIDKIKLPNTKIKLLQKMLEKAIAEFKKINRAKGVDFTKAFQALLSKYNERDEKDVWSGEELESIALELMDQISSLKDEMNSYEEMDIDMAEKAFYDILKSLAHKYDFDYPEERLLKLAKSVKLVVDDKTKYTDWNQRDDIKSELKVDLIILLADNDYPPVDRDEVYKEIFAQAENFKKYKG
ncbi:MAG: HsdR family type I site-specific deoxyribonuclease [Lentisphaeraceae bacterium]|nr:HsdR family type I site-specific deoxyribonuclease [Lentisphaeraceae bacterium]